MVVTTNKQKKLFLTIQTLLSPKNKILIPNPHYTSYNITIQITDATIISIPTQKKNKFNLNPTKIEHRITPRTRALLLISPNNPTTKTITPPNLHALTKIAHRHNLYVISNKIYKKLVYAPHEHLNINSLNKITKHTITINGFSKTFYITN